jgi:hypothetical protein
MLTHDSTIQGAWRKYFFLTESTRKLVCGQEKRLFLSNLIDIIISPFWHLNKRFDKKYINE